MSAYKRRCAFSGCGSAAGDCHLYAFPVHEPAACREWVRRADNPSLEELPPERLKNRNVCEKHFSPNAFQSKGRRRLRPFVKPIYTSDGRLIEDVDESEAQRLYPKSVPKEKTDTSDEEQLPIIKSKCKSLSALKARRMKAIAQSKLRRLAAKKPEPKLPKSSEETKTVTSPECVPIPAGAMLGKINAGNTSDVCCLCLCEDGKIFQITNVYLKDDYTEGSFSLATLVREMQLDKIISQNSFQSVCECCTKQLSLFYLFKSKCTKLASGLTNFYTFTETTKDNTNVVLPFETIQEYAVKVENSEFDVQMEIEVLKKEERLESSDVISMKRTTRSSKKDSEKIMAEMEPVKLIDISQNEAVTIIINEGTEDPLKCNSNVKFTRSEIAQQIELNKYKTVAKCIVQGKSYCSCCLTENQALHEVLETMLFMEGQEEVIAIQDLLFGINCNKIWDLEPSLICQDCLNITIRAFKFKTMFENSMILIRNCITGLENCLRNTEKFKHKKNMQIINLYEYLNEFLPAVHTRKTANVAKAITFNEFKGETSNSRKGTSKGKMSDTKDKPTSTNDKSTTSDTPKINSCNISKIRKRVTTTSKRVAAIVSKRTTPVKTKTPTIAEAIDDYAQSDRDFNSDDSNDYVIEAETIEQKIADPISACHICGEEFTSTDKEKVHISTVHTNVTACPYCNKIFSAKASIDNHIEKCKMTEKPFGCDLCNAVFALKKDADEHRVKHFPKTLKCDLCDTMVWTTRQLYLHKRVHKELLEKRTYECSICHSVHPSTKVLQKHMATHPPDSTHFCKYCWGTYKSRMTYNAHKCPGKVMNMQKTNVNQNEEETDVQDDNVENTEAPVEPESFKSTICDLCGLVVKSPKLLKKHRRRRHGIVDKNEPDKDICKTAMCDICGQFFKNVSTLRVHREYHKNDHEKEKMMQNKNVEMKIVKHHGKTYKRMFVKFTCEYCNNYETIYKTCLELHVNKQHLKIKPFKCSICDKCYYTKELLWAHHKGHSDISFQCNECGKKYKGRKALKIHMRSHTGERPYPCDMCDAKFVTACRRQVHKIRKHAEPTLQCKICLKLFYTNVSLRYHIRDCHSGNPKRKH